MRINPTVTSFGTSTTIIDALLAKERAEGAGPVQIGPGRKTVHTYHKGLGRERYTGRDLRRIRAERGVGRLHTTPADIDRALTALTMNQQEHFIDFWVSHNGDLVSFKVASGMKGNVWKKFLAKLDSLGLIDSRNAGIPRLTSLGRAVGKRLEDGIVWA